VDLSIVLSQYNRADADKLYSQEIKVVSNGIADPCPDFNTNHLPRRTARFNARQKLMSGKTLTPDDLKSTGGDPQNVKVLYVAHCTTEKGLFDTLYGVILANQRLAERRYGLKFQLQIAGTFVNPDEKAGFEQALSQPEVAGFVRYFGFVTGEQKNQLFRESDIFCFPTYYENENQPVNLIEAMAFGLPILTTRWRSIPELFPANYPGLVDIRSPEQIASVMLALLVGETGEGFRDNFLRNFTLERHLGALAEAFHGLEKRGSMKIPTVATPALR
jgi:glycosyltransferase involved in cell wall biosynthesis